MWKINEVIKYKRVFLTHELLGTRGLDLRNWGKNNLEVSSVSWLPIKELKGSCDKKGDRVKKSSFKEWNKFAQ